MSFISPYMRTACVCVRCDVLNLRQFSGNSAKVWQKRRRSDGDHGEVAGRSARGATIALKRVHIAGDVEANF